MYSEIDIFCFLSRIFSPLINVYDLSRSLYVGYTILFLNTTPPSIKLDATITAVRSIKKQQLVEVRSMANPPSVVKMALESICTLLGEKGDTWKGIRSVVMKDNFISTIVNFETENVTLVYFYVLKGGRWYTVYAEFLRACMHSLHSQVRYWFARFF